MGWLRSNGETAVSADVVLSPGFRSRVEQPLMAADVCKISGVEYSPLLSCGFWVGEPIWQAGIPRSSATMGWAGVKHNTDRMASRPKIDVTLNISLLYQPAECRRPTGALTVRTDHCNQFDKREASHKNTAIPITS